MTLKIICTVLLAAILIYLFAEKLAVYRYNALPSSRHIRIFILNRNNHSSTISGHFLTQYIDAPIEYDALSYVWGGQQRDHKIVCGGKILPVTKSLYVALNAYRQSSRWRGSETIPVWADGICINQQDPHEKKEQVRMMDDIYRRAHSVTVWLGEKTANSDLAMDFIIELNRDLMQLRRRAAPMSYFGNLESYGLRPQSDPAWRAFGQLLNVPYFTRIWILQEVVLGQRVTVTYGTKSVPWETLQSLQDNMQACKISLPQQAPMNLAYITMSKAAEESGQNIPLIRMLAVTRDFNSTEPVDKIFALLGLAKDGREYLCHVDYDQSAVQTFRNIAHTMLKSVHGFEMLSQVRHPKSIESLPSWVPDWSYNGIQRDTTTVSFYNHDFNAAAGLKRGGWSVDPNRPTVLSIRGGIVDDIKELGPPMHRIWDPQALSLYKTWDDECWKIASHVYSYPTGEPVQTAHWRTRIGNLSFTGQFADSSFGQSYAAWREVLDIELSGRVVDPVRYRRLDAESEAFATAHGQIISGRRFCLTRKGYFGMVPTMSQVGDSICVFAACHVPFVLHPVGLSHKLVGQCYVHGIMKGEAVRPSGFSLQDLSLI